MAVLRGSGVLFVYVYTICMAVSKSGVVSFLPAPPFHKLELLCVSRSPARQSSFATHPSLSILYCSTYSAL